MSKDSNRRIWVFLILTIVLSWPIWIASGVLNRGGEELYDFRWLVAQIGVFGPSLAALIVSAASRRELRLNSLRIVPVLALPLIVPGILTASHSPNKLAELPFLPAVMAILAATAVIVFFSPLNRRLLTPGSGEKQQKPRARWVFLSIVLFAGIFLLGWFLVNLQQGEWQISTLEGKPLRFAWIVLFTFAHGFLLGGSLGEEIGWRGFLLPELLRKTGPIAASFYLGIIWALWHAPIDLTSGLLSETPAAILIRIIWTLPIAFIFTWFYMHTKGNLLIAMFLHTSINITPDLGFQHFDKALIFFFLFASIAAITLATTSRVFQRDFVWHANNDVTPGG